MNTEKAVERIHAVSALHKGEDLLKKAGAGDVKLAFEKQAMDAYEAKLKQFKDPKIEYVEE